MQTSYHCDFMEVLEDSGASRRLAPVLKNVLAHSTKRFGFSACICLLYLETSRFQTVKTFSIDFSVDSKFTKNETACLLTTQQRRRLMVLTCTEAQNPNTICPGTLRPSVFSGPGRRSQSITNLREGKTKSELGFYMVLLMNDKFANYTNVDGRYSFKTNGPLGLQNTNQGSKHAPT
ncbi:hypothetical protein CSKR_108336 [Clonorchis sinensis]|uniref:Uncharacterized protein n=1 Tax=Clonorchis sinensis TaxID=79923 RepID=A0A3R7C5I0_CLOSI|nr:hypothetical protein CSKR_108336 [Clonorchis sinensis]